MQCSAVPSCGNTLWPPAATSQESLHGAGPLLPLLLPLPLPLLPLALALPRPLPLPRPGQRTRGVRGSDFRAILSVFRGCNSSPRTPLVRTEPAAKLVGRELECGNTTVHIAN